MEDIMTFTQPIEDFINRPTKRGTNKTRDTISTYRGAFNRIFQLISEKELVEASLDPDRFVDQIKGTNWQESTQLQTAKVAWMFLKSLDKNLPSLTDFVDELEANKRLRRGEVRSDDEHEEHYADTEGKLKVVEEEVTKFLLGFTTYKRRSILLAAYLMLIVPLRPSEAISIHIGPLSGHENYLDLSKREIVINEQKSKTVGERRISVPELFCELAVYRTNGWLFPSLRAASEGEPMNRTDYTKQLIRPATLEFFGKSVSSRDLRTSVISNKVKYEDGGLTPLEQVKFAKECGHQHSTQIDHYNVFEKAPQKTKITVRPKVDSGVPPAEVPKAEAEVPKTEPEVPMFAPKYALLIKSPTSRSWNGFVYKLENISFSILEKIAELVPDHMEIRADCTENKYSVTLSDVKLKLYVQIEKLFLGDTSPISPLKA